MSSAPRVSRESVSPLDRGLHFGDGLFETIACLRGRPRFLSLHLERLAEGCRQLQIPMPDLEEIRAQVQALVSGGIDRALIKVVVTRGVTLARGYAFSGSEQATCI